MTKRSTRHTLTASLCAASLLAVAAPPAAAATETAPAEPVVLNSADIPDDVSVEDAEEFLEAEEELTEEDLHYAAVLDELAETTDTDFYDVPGQLPEEEGQLIRQQPGTFYLDPINLVEHDAAVTTIMYRTTDSNEQARAATATVLEPAGAHGETPVIVQAPGTQGLGDQCAPSRQMAAGTEYEGIAVSAALEAGYTVVMPDYIGLGTEGVHTYMNRVDQAHAVLDAARAAQQAEGVAITAEAPVVLRGYSQGGGAAAAALELASDYAGELNVISGSAGAVPANLFDVSSQIDGTLYTAFLLFALGGVVEYEGLDPAQFLNEAGLERLEQARGECTISALINHRFLDTSTLTLDGRSFTELIQDEPFHSALTEQLIGNGRVPDVPVQITHSLFDDVIPYRTGENLARQWCEAGARVSFDSNVGPTHIGGMVAALPAVGIFTRATLNDRSTLNSCWRL